MIPPLRSLVVRPFGVIVRLFVSFLSLILLSLLLTFASVAAASEEWLAPVERPIAHPTTRWESPSGQDPLDAVAESQDVQGRATVENWVLVTFQGRTLEDDGSSHWDLFVGQPLNEPVQLTHGPYNSVHPRLHPALSSIVFAAARPMDHAMMAPNSLPFAQP